MGEAIMGFGNDLVRHVREDHDLTLAQVGLAADLSESTICRAELGERELLARHVRALFAITVDLRLIQYMFPGVSIASPTTDAADEAASAEPRQRPTRTPPAGDPGQSNARLIEAIERLAGAARYNAKTMRDGVVKESEYEMVAIEQGLLNKVAGIIAEHQRNLVAWVDENERKVRRER